MFRLFHPLTLAVLLPMTMTPPVQAQTAAATPKVYDVREFFRKPERSSFRLAADGRHLSFLARDTGRLNIFVQALDAKGSPVGDATALTHESERDVSGYFWKGSKHLVYTKDFGGDENFHVLSVAIDGRSAPRDLTPFDAVRAEIVDDLKDDDRHLLVSHNKRNKEVFDVYRIDVETGDAHLVAENPATS